MPSTSPSVGITGNPSFSPARTAANFSPLLDHHADQRRVLVPCRVDGHVLMPNHFHLVLTGQVEGGVSRLLQHVTAQYAQYLHGRLNRRGRLWQSRFYSCVLDTHHFFTALAYVDLNPVRARLTDRAADYPWSSAAAHCGLVAVVPEWLDVEALHARFPPDAWRERLATPQPRGDVAALRRATRAESALKNLATAEKPRHRRGGPFCG